MPAKLAPGKCFHHRQRQVAAICGIAFCVPFAAALAAGISIANVSADEAANPAIHRVPLVVTNGDAVPGGFTIPWVTADGTATAGQDYRAAAGTLTFAGTAGETQSVFVDLLGDTVADAGETFTVMLGAPSSGAVVVDDPVATVTITESSSPIPAPRAYEVNVTLTVKGAPYTGTITSWFAEHPEPANSILFLWDIPTDFGGRPGAPPGPFDPTTSPSPPLPFEFPTAGEDASGALVVHLAQWQTRSRLMVVPTIVDTGQALSNVDLGLREGVGRRDAPAFRSAEQVIPDQFTFDFVKPVVLAVTPSSTLLDAADTGSGAFTLTITFSKSMLQSIAPTIVFTGADLSATLVPAGGTWSDDHTYVATYDVADDDQFASAVAVTVSGATDDYPIFNSVPIGNPVVPRTIAAAFAVRMTDPPTVGLTLAPVQVTNGSQEPVIATFTFTNPNTVPLTGAAFDLMLPASMVVANAPGTGSSCGGTVTAPALGRDVALSGATIPASAACTMTLAIWPAGQIGMFTLEVPPGALRTANTDPSTMNAQASVTFAAAVVPTLSSTMLGLLIAALALAATRAMRR